jgi:hypothetical protein
MNERICENESSVLAAMRSGVTAESWQRHVASCPGCSAAVAAERAMTELAAGLAADVAPLPAASAIWLRGRLRARAEAETRALRPLAIWQGLAALVAAVGMLVGFTTSRGLFGSLAGGEISPAQLMLIAGLAALVVLPALALRRARS